MNISNTTINTRDNDTVGTLTSNIFYQRQPGLLELTDHRIKLSTLDQKTGSVTIILDISCSEIADCIRSGPQISVVYKKKKYHIRFRDMTSVPLGTVAIGGAAAVLGGIGLILQSIASPKVRALLNQWEQKLIDEGVYVLTFKNNPWWTVRLMLITLGLIVSLIFALSMIAGHYEEGTPWSGVIGVTLFFAMPTIILLLIPGRKKRPL